MQLLVSVRSPHEAQNALAGGADIIDAKEPSAGALGAVSLHTFETIVRSVASRRLVTAAIGDADGLTAVQARAAAFARAGAAFVKLGFAGIRCEATVASFTAAMQAGAHLSGAGSVAVAYADYDAAGTLAPDTIVEVAARAGASGVLLDTAAKNGPALTDLMALSTLVGWVRRVHERGMFAVVAGRLAVGDLAVVGLCGAAVAGVRGAACEGGRDGAVSVEKVRGLTAALQGSTRRRLTIPAPRPQHAESTDRPPLARLHPRP